MATTIEQRLDKAERVGEQVNRVIDLWAPQIGALIRIARRLIDAAKARGEDVGTAEAELAALEAGIGETQAIVDQYKAFRDAERAIAPATAAAEGAEPGPNLATMAAAVTTLIQAWSPTLATTIRLGRSVEQVLRAQGREAEAVALAADLAELDGQVTSARANLATYAAVRTAPAPEGDRR